MYICIILQQRWKIFAAGGAKQQVFLVIKFNFMAFLAHKIEVGCLDWFDYEYLRAYNSRVFNSYGNVLNKFKDY